MTPILRLLLKCLALFCLMQPLARAELVVVVDARSPVTHLSQTEVVNIMETEDLNAIKAKINELKARDPGAFAGDAIVVEVKEAAGGAEETGEYCCVRSIPIDL